MWSVPSRLSEASATARICSGRLSGPVLPGMRCSAAAAYLHPAMSWPNLKVITDAIATRILFDGNRASGVEIARDGRLEEIRAETEVILAAGAYNSPQLLMLSGIGPARDLVALQISVRGDLPVGVGLQDHPMAWMSWHSDTESLLTAATPENVALLQSEGRGPLSSNGGEAGGFIRTRAGLDAPDVQFHACPAIVYDQSLSRPTEHGVLLQPLRVETAQPREGLAPNRQSVFQTDDHTQLLCGGGGSPVHD